MLMRKLVSPHSQLVILIFTLLVSDSLRAQQKVTGRVVDDAEGAAIPAAHVLIYEQSGKLSFILRPDSRGVFTTVELPDGYYDVFVGSAGFTPFCKSIWAHEGKSIDLKIRLKPDLKNSQFN